MSTAEMNEEFRGRPIIKMATRSEDRWRCCFGLHVRTATILIGMWHLFLNFSIMVLLAVLIRHPEMITITNADMDDGLGLGTGVQEEAPALPTPLSKVELRYAYEENNRLTSQNIDMGVMACLLMMGFTMLMVTGAIKGKPAHLLPFFGLQLFDFFVTTLTAAGYMCYLRNLHRFVAESNRMPWRDLVLQLSPNVLALFVLVSFVGTILLKVYILGIVWRCYKYLTILQNQASLALPYVIPVNGAQMGTDRYGRPVVRGANGDVSSMARPERDYNTLLPGYDEALAQSMKQQPPPSYQVAMASPTEVTAQTAAQHSEASEVVVGATNTTATGITVVLPPTQSPAGPATTVVVAPASSCCSTTAVGP